MGCGLKVGNNGEKFGGEWVKNEISIVKRKVGGRKDGMWIIGVCSIMV